MYRHNVVISCGTVALMVLGQFSDIYGPIKKSKKKPPRIVGPSIYGF
jgi:hypothetical protein